MVSVSLKRSDMFAALRKHNFENSDKLYNDVVKLIEAELKMSVKRPISLTLRNEIISKLSCLRNQWSRAAFIDISADSFQQEVAWNVYKIHVYHDDLEKDVLLARYVHSMEEIELKNRETNQLKESMIKLKTYIDLIQNNKGSNASPLPITADSSVSLNFFLCL
jgi:hypothetical protein